MAIRAFEKVEAGLGCNYVTHGSVMVIKPFRARPICLSSFVLHGAPIYEIEDAKVVCL